MSRMTSTETKAVATKIKETCARLGWRYDVRDRIFTVTKSFQPGDLDEFRKADCEYYSIIGLLPRTRPGSDWGTDGGGVGGYHAHKTGCFEMNRSGGNLNVLKELAKL